MRKFVMLCVIVGAASAPFITVAATATNHAVHAKEGWALYSKDGRWLGAIHKVSEDGSVELVLNDKLVVIPASTLLELNGKLITRLTKSDVDGLPQQTN